jgi:hypothetical protein
MNVNFRGRGSGSLFVVSRGMSPCCEFCRIILVLLKNRLLKNRRPGAMT